MSGFEKIIQLLITHYYGDLIVGVLELTAIIVGWLYIKRDRSRYFFIMYLSFDFLIIPYNFYVVLFASFTNEESAYFVCFTNILISLSEFLAYYYFYSKIIHNKTVIKLMKILKLIFIAVVIIFVSTGFNFITTRYYYVSVLIQVTELLFLVAPCFVYFYELLKNDPILKLYERPSFWIVTGVFFYSVISMPSYLLDSLISRYEQQNWNFMNLLFFYIPISINSLFLTKAFLCKKTLTI